MSGPAEDSVNTAKGLTSEQTLALILPPNVAHAYAGHLVDENGIDYIDMVSAWGTNILGYGHPGVAKAIAAQAGKYANIGMAGPEYSRLYHLLLDKIPCAEALHFMKNGSDATASAVRLARFATRRDKVLHFGYHGVQDWYMASIAVPGVPQSHYGEIVTLQALDLACVTKAFNEHPGQIACLMIDPMLCVAASAAQMREIAELVQSCGALLVFDEVVSGFRVSVGGMQEVWGVTPDLACYGKGIANGMPLSVLAGREKWMRHIAAINYSLTFGLEAVSMAAAIATIEEIVEKNVCAALAAKGRRLKNAYADLCRKHGVASVLTGHDTRPQLHFDPAPAVAADVLHYIAIQELARQRICTYGIFSFCYAHDEDDLSMLIQGLDIALEKVSWTIEVNAPAVSAA